MKKIIVFVLLGLILVVHYRIWLSPEGVMETFRLKQRLLEQQLKNDALLEQNRELQKEIDLLKVEGNRVIEDKAREDLGMVKKGEVYYHVVK